MPSGRVDPSGVPRGRENRPVSGVQVARGRGGRHGSIAIHERPKARGLRHRHKRHRMAKRSRTPR